MKTNSKQVRELVRQHILDCVYDENENTYDNIGDACKRLSDEFERVAGYEHNLKRIPNNQDRFSDYLQGLPFHFHFVNSDVESFLNGLGINPENKEFDSDKSLKLYHYLIFREMLEFAKS